MIFLPQKTDVRKQWQQAIEKQAELEGLKLLGWRDVLVNDGVIAGDAKVKQPFIEGSVL